MGIYDGTLLQKRMQAAHNTSLKYNCKFFLQLLFDRFVFLNKYSHFLPGFGLSVIMKTISNGIQNGHYPIRVGNDMKDSCCLVHRSTHLSTILNDTDFF
jgi:hypothetical protein